MIVRPKTSWFRMLFAWEDSVQGTILAPLGIILVLSLAALWGHYTFDGFRLRLSPVPFSLIGVALAIFASFRNNACYDRYWEGRKLWGVIGACARDLTRYVVTMPALGAGDPEARRVVNLLLGFVHALKHQLRGSDPAAALRALLGEPDAREALRHAYRPHFFLVQVQRQLAEWRHRGRIGEVAAVAALEHLDTLNRSAGACERIRTTPVPYPYEVLLHRTTYFYCALLPFGLVESVGWATPIVAVFIAYAFLALHIIAGELEDPFGCDANDLPLDALTVHIERSVLETAGATDLPPVPVPDARYRLD